MASAWEPSLRLKASEVLAPRLTRAVPCVLLLRTTEDGHGIDDAGAGSRRVGGQRLDQHAVGWWPAISGKLAVPCLVIGAPGLGECGSFLSHRRILTTTMILLEMRNPTVLPPVDAPPMYDAAAGEDCGHEDSAFSEVRWFSACNRW